MMMLEQYFYLFILVCVAYCVITVTKIWWKVADFTPVELNINYPEDTVKMEFTDDE